VSQRSGDVVPNFRYRALTQGGELVNGSISASTAGEVARRIEYLGLVPIEAVAEEASATFSRTFAFMSRRVRTT
jgi:general secretion pathway protein F